MLYPDEFRLEGPVLMQCDSTVGRRLIVDCKFVAAGFELSARGRRADNLYAMVFAIIGLVHVTKYGQTYFSGCRNAFEKLIRRVEADRVQPGAAHDNGRVMQAYHDMLGIAGFDGLIKAFVFAPVDGAARAVTVATVDANDQPVIHFGRIAIEKGRCANRPLHEFANVVIARHTVHGQPQRPHELDKTLVGVCRFVLDEVARGRYKIRVPAARLVMLKDSRKRGVSDGAPKASGGVTEKMRVR